MLNRKHDKRCLAGLWMGTTPNFYMTVPFSATPININASRASCAFNNVNIMRGTTYTIGLFMSGYQHGGGSKQTTVACSAGFTN